jgi:hypothetical protein
MKNARRLRKWTLRAVIVRLEQQQQLTMQQQMLQQQLSQGASKTDISRLKTKVVALKDDLS